MKLSMRTVLWSLLGIGVMLAAAYALLPQPIRVELAEIERGFLQVTIDEDGKTRIKDRYVVSAPVAGRLLRITLRAGDEVTAGATLLASLEPSDPKLLDARDLAEAEARVKASEAGVSRAKSRLEETKSQLDLAESELGRYNELNKSNSISKREFDIAQALYRLRSEQYRSARFEQDIADFELQMAQAALLHATSAPGDSEPRFEIRSPITGRVLRVLQESSTVVQPGAALLEIGDPADLEVEIDVLSTDAVKISVGDPVLLEHWGGEQTLRGTVRRIEPAAFTKISALGVEEQRVNVLVDFGEKPEQLPRLGDAFRVEAKIVIWQGDDVLKVPTSALFRDRDRWAVFVETDGKAQLRRVEIGKRNSSAAEVQAGLDPQELVVRHPSDKIEDGTKISGNSTRERED